MIDFRRISRLRRGPPSSLLGLSLDGSRLEGVVLRRTNGSIQAQPPFAATLSLDLLTADPELVGREIRNHLNAAGVRERTCVVAVPLKWALVIHTKIPKLPEGEIPGFLQIEAERGFPCDVTTLMLAISRYQSASGEEYATLIGIPRGHLGVLERVLRAAQLKPAGFSLGLTSLQSPELKGSEGVLALAVGETQVGLQVTCGGGVASLRALEGALDAETGRPRLDTELVAREARITLGQMPEAFRQAVRRVRIFGPHDLAQQLSRDLKARFEPMGLTVEPVTAYADGEFGVRLPRDAGVSPAFSLAAWRLAGGGPNFEFLPPRVTALQQLAARYSSGTLQRAAAVAGVAALVGVGLFLFQQVQLWRLRSQWGGLQARVRAVEEMQQNIRQYRPWFNTSLRSLSILKQLTEAFPQDGVVSATSVEISDPNTVRCSGIARDNQALLKTMEKLRAAPSVADVKVDTIRGKAPMQFTFEFHWKEGNE